MDGLWDFAFLGDVDPSSVNIELLAFDQRIPVPSSFDSLPAYAGQRGLAAYRTSFSTSEAEIVEIEFEAAGFWAQPFLDGRSAGSHACGYSKFARNWPAVFCGTHTLVVLVDNRFDFSKVPLHESYFDFYQWGGITRSVWAHEKPAFFIESVNVITRNLPAREIEVSVRFGGTSEDVQEVAVYCDEVAVATRCLDSDATRLCLTHCLSDSQPWDCAHPELHILRVVVGDDDMIIRFGIRTICVSDGRVLLNNEPLKLFGFNRHESHPQFGCSLPLTLLASDVMWLKRMNCNFVRGAHYPQDQRFLDLCDEAGILVWEEGLGWGQKAEQLQAPHFESAHRNMIHEMIDASFNHPSVICWGFLNEAATNSEDIRSIMESTVRLIRELDCSRLVTYASMFPKEDCYFDLVDIVSVNLYPGWYGCLDNPAPLELIRPSMRDVAAFLYKAHGKPLIISEIGCEALYGWRDPLNGFYTEHYQGEYLQEAILEVIENPEITGIAIWHFSDARTYSSGRAISRPRAFNNKGVLDEYRRPKESMGVVSRLFASAESSVEARNSAPTGKPATILSMPSNAHSEAQRNNRIQVMPV